MASGNTLAELAAILAHEASFIQHSSSLRPAYYGEPSPQQNVKDAAELLRLGRGFKRRAELACSGVSKWSPEHNRMLNGWDDSDEAAKDRADQKAAKRAAEIAATYGATIRTGGDPRGFVLRLILKSGRSNGWDDGWGIA